MHYLIHRSLAESDDFDLLVMGGPEGAGCYCYANNLVHAYMQELSSNYNYMVLDNEAGLEHLSRHTTEKVDVLFAVSDSSARGVRSAGRVGVLAESLALHVKKILLVVNKADAGTLEALYGEIARTGLELAGTIPLDKRVREYDLHGRPLAGLPGNAAVVTAVDKIIKTAGIL